MKIHEYQAKNIFREYGINVLDGVLVLTPEEAHKNAQLLNCEKWVVKAQVHAGGRGKGGGIKLAKSLKEVKKITNEMIGMKLITPQTGKDGTEVKKVYIEQACNIRKEYYLGIVLDRAKGKFTMMASSEGGMDIEKVAAEYPEKIYKEIIDPHLGFTEYQCRRIAFFLKIPSTALNDFVRQVLLLAKAAVEKDLLLIEINPLILNEESKVIALDAKINIDDNALFRNPELKKLIDETEVDKKELEAEKLDLSYVKLDGKIGCMVNGAGLAMATMDIIKLKGSSPANFLDVGGGASKEKVVGAMNIILSDKDVKAVLVNIFGGIMRCDIIAEGIVEAAKKNNINIPLVIRLEGTNVEKGKNILKSSGLSIISATDLEEAATKIVDLVEK
tara:strand:- start:702 stop:1865 length:1164 start_codon:yes stop_codon:yes gene_type:complete